MEKTPLISCQNVSLVIEKQTLLDNISFTLQSGEDLVVFGPNGAGKTLLLSVLSGNLPPTDGKVTIFGKPLYAHESYLIKKQIGFVSPKLFDDYEYGSSVPEIVMSGLFGSIGIVSDPVKDNNAAVRDYIKRVIAQKYQGETRAIELLEKLGVLHLKDEVFGHLSYGEKVRVLIARSLINNPPLFILDEPTTGLDLQMRAQFAEVIEQLTKTSEIIYVTHHLDEVTPHFTKVLFLKQGKVFGFGNKEEMFKDQMLSELLNTPISVHLQNGRYFAMFN